MVTRCPQCNTCFRVTTEQLKTAKGAVRCGSCLHIFKALDHLLTPTGDNNTTSTATENSSDTPRATASSFDLIADEESADSLKPERLAFDQAEIDKTIDEDPLDDDDLLISDDMDQQEDGNKDLFDTDFSDSFLELENWQPEAKSLFDRDPKNPNFNGGDRDHTDESWAEDLLKELEQEQENAGSEDDSVTAGSTGTDTGTVSEEAVEAILGEPLRDANEPSLGELDLQTLDQDEPTENAPDRITNHDPDTDQDRREPTEQARDNFGARGLVEGEEPSAASDYLSNIEPEPVELDYNAGPANWPRKLLWSSLSLLAGLGILAQLAWFQFDDYARREPYRSWYALICPITGCQLPPLVDRAKISAYNLVIRSHPRAEKALMIDAILLNKARFRQPFPELALTFSDLQENPIASRRFRPEEYLRGELAGKRWMPPGQPVHLSLEVVDPGPEAVNYRAYIP